MRSTRFIFLTILIFFCVDSFAQVLIGPVIGGQSSWTMFEDQDADKFFKAKPFIGFHAGASVSFRVQKRFFLQTSLLYSRKGKKLEGIKGGDTDFSNISKYNYIDMPILYTAEFKGKLGDKKTKEFKWYIGIGPTVSYWLGGKGVLTSSDLLEANITSLPYKIVFDKKREDVKEGEMNVNDANRIQLALNVSAGLILEPVGFNKIVVAVRYEHGHSFLSRTSDGIFGGYTGVLYYTDDMQVRLQTFTASLYYFIDLKTDQRNKGRSTIKTKKGKLR